jgi:hypothetical protein
MHGAIITAIKTSTPKAKALPVIQLPAPSGCC